MTAALDRERAILDMLRDRYEGSGGVFVAYPSRDLVPSFLGNYQPDAIVKMPNESLVIEVRGQTRPNDPKLAEIAQRVAGQTGWRFLVVKGDDVLPNRPAPPNEQDFGWALGEFETARAHGLNRAALLLGFATLEAAVRLRFPDIGGVGPDRIALRLPQLFAENGILTGPQERDLRGLAKLRNDLAHGAVNIAVEDDDIRRLGAILATTARQIASPDVP